MATHSNAVQSDAGKALSPKAQADDLKAASRGRSGQLANAVTSFAEMLAPRRRVIRDPYYDVAIRDHDARPQADHRFGIAEWAMIVVAGIALGVVLALIFAGV
jgi:hypothetical protein